MNHSSFNLCTVKSFFAIISDVCLHICSSVTIIYISASRDEDARIRVTYTASFVESSFLC